jgi:hypothetical protein
MSDSSVTPELLLSSPPVEDYVNIGTGAEIDDNSEVKEDQFATKGDGG